MNNIIAAFCFGCLFGVQVGSWNAEAEAIKGLDSKDVETRRSAAIYFQFMYRKVPQGFSPSKEVMSALLKALDDPDSEVRHVVVHTFSRFDEASRPAVPLLASLMRIDKEVSVRRVAASALLMLGPVSKEALPALIEAAKDKDKLVRIYAGTAVVGLGKDNEKALRFLLAFSTDEDEFVQSEASSAFVYIGVRAIPILKDGVKDKNPVIRRWTIGAFISVLTKDVERAKFPADVISLLINAIGDDDKDV